MIIYKYIFLFWVGNKAVTTPKAAKSSAVIAQSSAVIG